MFRRVSTLVPSASRAFGVVAPSRVALKKYDIFFYEVDANTAPWIEKLKKCKYYDDAGDVIVEMNLANCPPDLDTYNALVHTIASATSKQAEPIPGENKFAAIMDVVEEMHHRNGIKPDGTTWNAALKATVDEGNWRTASLVLSVMKERGHTPDGQLATQAAALESKAVSSGRVHPAHVMKSESNILDMNIEGA